MAAIHDLIRQIAEPALRDRLLQEWEVATKEKKFGLVFENHLPECLPIWSTKPRRNDRVALKSGALNDLWVVRKIQDGQATCERPDRKGETAQFTVEDLLVVRPFGDPIFPTLVPMGHVQNGPADAPWHTLIEADNYHALQLLDYLYAGQVDCIYIDPPYNTGARDWKYNNDYVDGNDGWRHSKWLAFMEKRIKLAKRLLNPKNGALIITIDEKEYLHLGMLLEQTFPDARIQMISSLINPAIVARAGGFGRSDEYIFVVLFGDAMPERLRLSREWVSSKGRTHTGNVRWDLLRRSGTNAERSHSPGCFYPIYVDPKTKQIKKIGSPLPPNKSVAKAIPGLIPVLPIRKNKTEGNWQWSPETLEERKAMGRVRVGGNATRGFTIYILKDGEFAKIQRGEFQECGYAEDGSILTENNDASYVLAIPGSQWRIASHDATQYGSRILSDVIPGRRFPFPKSIYAVRDTLRFFVEKNPNAIILDFFAGSGTTLNAVNLLNASDGGQRRCIMVTNNEVSAEESEDLHNQGLQPGSDPWESKGICRSITWPRSKFTILGHRDDGSPLSGEYLSGKIIEEEGERNYRQIGFVDPSDLDSVGKKKQVVALIDGLPQTLVTGECPFIVSEEHKASILFNPDAADDWLEALEDQDHITDVYIVTPVKRNFDALKAKANEILGPLIAPEEEKRPMSEGFEANLAYFRLDFLDPARVALKQSFREILPLLWLKAGARGPRPECPEGQLPRMLIPKANTFAVLLSEAALSAFVEGLRDRNDLTHLFLVTDDQDAFKDMMAELNDHLGEANPNLAFTQLYRDYLENFFINKGQVEGGTA